MYIDILIQTDILENECKINVKFTQSICKFMLISVQLISRMQCYITDVWGEEVTVLQVSVFRGWKQLKTVGLIREKLGVLPPYWLIVKVGLGWSVKSLVEISLKSYRMRWGRGWTHARRDHGTCQALARLSSTSLFLLGLTSKTVGAVGVFLFRPRSKSKYSLCLLFCLDFQN